MNEHTALEQDWLHIRCDVAAKRAREAEAERWFDRGGCSPRAYGD